MVVRFKGKIMKNLLDDRVVEVSKYLEKNEFNIISGENLVKKAEIEFEKDYGKFALFALNFVTLETYNKKKTIPNLMMKNAGFVLISLLFAILFTVFSISADMLAVNFFLSLFAVLMFSSVLIELFERTKDNCELESKEEKITKQDLLLIYDVYGYDGLDFLLGKYKNGITLRDFVNEFKSENFEEDLAEFKKLKKAKNMIISGLNEEIRKKVEGFNE